MREKKVNLIGCDAGGTMTDVFVIDEEGNFTVGKASTTPHDESVGFWESLADSFEYWEMDWSKISDDVLKDVLTIVYSGTAMLNTLISRTGALTGLICTKGFEDTLLHERGAQVHAGYGYQDKIHKVAHAHNDPFIARKYIRGVTERISMFGEPLIPLYEEDVCEAADYLLSRGVESIVIWFVSSYLNPMHEKKAEKIVKEMMRERGMDIPIYLTGILAPIMREVSRLNAVILQAYGAEPARKHLFAIEQNLKKHCYKNPLQIVLADGGIGNIRYPALYKACFSGPIGGLLGAKYISQVMDMPNIACSDMGGTSFDVGLIMGGESQIVREVELGRTILNIPTMVMDSIGAGCGMYVSIDPESKRISIGPGSAGADPGPVSYNMGNDIPTLMDCVLLLGLLNPDNYLGGKVKLDTNLALKAIKEKCSDVIGVDPYHFSEGVIDLINDRMREHIKTVLSVRGYSPMDYYLIGYGGAGPLFLAGYSAGLPFKGVFTMPWAAAFSSFGTTVIDYIHRYQRSTIIQIAPALDEKSKMEIGAVINGIWEELEKTALGEMTEEGFSAEHISYTQVAYVRFMGQLEDLEVISPVQRIQTGEDLDKLMEAFEDLYSMVYTHGAKHSEAGYQILEMGLISSVPKPKPVIRKYPLEGKTPPGGAGKGTKDVYTKGTWKKTRLYDLDKLLPGNEVEGPAILEAASTTMPIPEGKKVLIDEFKRYWLEEV